MTDKGMRGEHREGTVEEISDRRASDEALMVHGARILPLNPKTEEVWGSRSPILAAPPPPKVPGNRLVKLESKNYYFQSKNRKHMKHQRRVMMNRSEPGQQIQQFEGRKLLRTVRG